MPTGPGQPLLSAILIVKNEEANLPRCLASLRGIPGLPLEIVVVDTGSTDGTRALAEVEGARVLDFPWNGSEADARNVSVAHATGRWLLHIDADEELSPALREELPRALAEADAGKAQAFSLVLRNFYGNGTSSLSRVVRIGRAAPGFLFHGVIHAAPAYGAPVAALHGELFHYGYQWTPETRLRKGRHLLDQLALRPEAERATLRHFSEWITALLIAGEKETFLREWPGHLRFPAGERTGGPEAHFWSYALGNALAHFTEEEDFATGSAAADEMAARHPAHVRAALYRIRRAAREDDWDGVRAASRPCLDGDSSGLGPGLNRADFFQSIPADAGEILGAWEWLTARLAAPAEPALVPDSLWKPALLPFFWRAGQALPEGGKLIASDAAATALLSFRAALAAGGKPENAARIDRVASGALGRAEAGSATHLLALFTLYWLNQRLGRRDPNLGLVGEALERYGTVPWLALAFSAAPGEEAFGAFLRRALTRL